ncbi:chromosome transmission fidelity protein 18 homolog [Heliangelus exortis]|uniref:chromosome transmission fidelity protein 18 homolog n=1 Tax=Heliangelus exortis TaxID=472823 RepID=UPI003A8DB707
MAGTEEAPEEGFYQRFADELEVLAELGDDPFPPSGPQISRFRSKKQLPEEPDPPGDPLGDSNPGKRERGCDPPSSPPSPAARTPKPKRQRLEAVKKLNFGANDEFSPADLQDAVPGAPQAASLDPLEMSGMVPLQTTPPSEVKRVLKRAPILEDYINVTSTQGTRVFMVLRDEHSRTGVELPDSLGWNTRRPLHLLGVPFSYLKEQVDQERRRHLQEVSQQLTEIINSPLLLLPLGLMVPLSQVALLCGPPGLGKTTLAHVIARHAGYNAVEMNASDDRSPEVFRTRIEAATQMRSVLGANEKPNCLIIDEIDGAPAASINVLLSIVQRKDGEGEPGARRRRQEGGLLLRPIICICNDQYVPALRPLRHQSFLLTFPRTSSSRLAQRLCEVTLQQGMRADMGALLALCQKTENDIRSCINTLQFLHGRGQKELSVQMVQTMRIGLKDQNKGLFSIWQEIFQLPKVQRHRIGMDPALPTQFLVGDEDLVGMGSLTTSSHRFHRILHLAVSSGEQEKLAQGLYENFLNMKLRDSSLSSVCLALEWLGFSDLLSRAVLQCQNFQLLRYLPFLPVAFHLLFAATNVPRLAYPSSQQDALAKLHHMQNLVVAMVSGITPSARSRAGQQALVLEVLCLLLDIIAPKLRPVNTQLYSQKEKQQLADLISIMLAYNLTYHQERLPEGQYVYKLDPNLEDVCRFPELPTRRQLSYQTKQLIAREIELEKMRRMEALLQARNLSQDPRSSEGEKQGPGGTSVPPNHQQHLESIIWRARVEDKPETDFFGRPLQRVTRAPVPEGPEEGLERQVGQAVGQSDVWFRFNEGVSNAVRRNIYIRDLL